jgi:endonuclease-8
VPEGDTIARAAGALHRTLAGHTVARFATGYAHLARVDDDSPIAGRTIETCVARGKHLLIAFSGGLVLRTHMRMHGSWHLYRPGEAWRRPATAMRVLLETGTWVAVAFDVPVAEFLHAGGLASAPALARLGPDLLDPAFDHDEAVARIAACGARPLSEVLLDQRVIAGLGNVYRSELLFLAGLAPDVTAADAPLDALGRPVDAAVRLMRANVRHARGFRRNTTGRMAPGEDLWVYQRTGLPCRRCGTSIRSAERGSGTRRVYWCPACQPPAREGG